MILQIVNIGAGALLTSTVIKKHVPSAENFFTKVQPYEAGFGVVVLVLGVMGLLQRLGIFYFSFSLGASFPQALPAIASGLLLGAPLLSRYAAFKTASDKLQEYSTYVGMICILVGLGSLLFGCVSPVLCRMPF